jgi:hypothetical protein
VPPPAADPDEAAPAPIRIHIGRIDVRATIAAPQPPSSRLAPQAPRLSLDDYLRTKNGGVR